MFMQQRVIGPLSGGSYCCLGIGRAAPSKSPALGHVLDIRVEFASGALRWQKSRMYPLCA